MDEMWMRILIFLGIYLVIFVVSTWRIFVKANYKGYLALIPFYNFVILYRILDMPFWYFFLLFVPVVGWLINHVVIALRLVKAFDKDFIWNIGLIGLPFVYYPVLAFNNSVYVLHTKKMRMKEEADAIMYNQFPDVEEAIPEIVGNEEMQTVVSEPAEIMDMNESSNYEPVDLPTYDPYSMGEDSDFSLSDDSVEGEAGTVSDESVHLEENFMKNDFSEFVEQGLGEVVGDDAEILTIDDDATWNHAVREEGPVDVMKPVIEEDPMKDVLVNPMRYGPTDLDQYKECPNCHTKLSVDAKVCFLCGTQIDGEN